MDSPLLSLGSQMLRLEQSERHALEHRRDDPGDAADVLIIVVRLAYAKGGVTPVR
jgi:hypothetical protein